MKNSQSNLFGQSTIKNVADWLEQQFSCLVLNSSNNTVEYISSQLKAVLGLPVGSEFCPVIEMGSCPSSFKMSRDGREFLFRRFQLDAYIFLLVEDVTDAELMAKNLKKGQETLMEAQAMAQLGSWEWDIQSGSLEWSDEIYRIFGLEPQEFGASYDAFLSYVHPEDRQGVIDAVNRSIETGTSYNIEHRVLWKNGTIRYVYEHGRVYYDTLGKPLRMIGVVHDITHRKLYEETLQNMNSILEQRVLEKARKLEEVQDRLVHQEKLVSLGTLVAGVAHEIKNPLNILKGSVESIQEFIQDYPLETINKANQFSELGLHFKQDFQFILPVIQNQEKHILRIDEIVKSMLGLVKGQNYHFEENAELNAIIQRAVNLCLKARPVGERADVVYKLAPNLPKMKLMISEMERVVINVMDNAIYAMKDTLKPQLHIRTELITKNQVQMEFTDNGVGISEENRKRIFEPFFTTKPSNEGTGLGLHICYDIVKAHGGSIAVESGLGCGTSFRIIMPLVLS